ncbi:hypothetical protein DL95DRAFT_196413 [Leptodontidium sp. 2 PMI_412]|nr:hypothetical protein BKA61DRAFT_217301 [Leptodontidium sp. MPI-SDFR-AT-0119]KAH9210677.1 hypothetical protein DL95DRAFT_196413 [Leptodontidium sp. 2 PMI_412]
MIRISTSVRALILGLVILSHLHCSALLCSASIRSDPIYNLNPHPQPAFLPSNPKDKLDRRVSRKKVVASDQPINQQASQPDRPYQSMSSIHHIHPICNYQSSRSPSPPPILSFIHVISESKILLFIPFL